MAKHRQKAHVEKSEDQSDQHQAQEKIAASHGSGLQAFEKLPHSHVDQHESDSPHPAPHQVHANQAGEQKVDVAAADFLEVRFGEIRCLFRQGAPQNRIFDRLAGEHAFGPMRFKPESRWRRIRLARFDHQVRLARLQALLPLIRGWPCDFESRVFHEPGLERFGLGADDVDQIGFLGFLAKR